MTELPPYLTILCDNTEELPINETVKEFHNARMIQVAKKTGFMHGIHCLIWLQVPHRDFLQDFAVKKSNDFLNTMVNAPCYHYYCYE